MRRGKYPRKPPTPEEQAAYDKRHQEWLKTQKKYKIGQASLELDGYNKNETRIRFSYKGQGIECSVAHAEVHAKVNELKKEIRG